MKCPDCGAELGPFNYRDILIHECPKCKGRWFERDELRKAKDKADDDLRWLDFDPFGKEAAKFQVASRGKHCPRCSVKMMSLTYQTSRVIIDECQSCRGIWLDHGEFQAIIRYLETIVATEGASEYTKDVFRQFLQIPTGPKGPISEVRDFLVVLKLLEERMMVEHPALAEAAQKMYQYWPLK